jgi:hypothetical protein
MKAKPHPTVAPVTPEPSPPIIQVADLVLEEVLDRNEHPLVFTGSARQYRSDWNGTNFSRNSLISRFVRRPVWL